MTYIQAVRAEELGQLGWQAVGYTGSGERMVGGPMHFMRRDDFAVVRLESNGRMYRLDRALDFLQMGALFSDHAAHGMALAREAAGYATAAEVSM